MVVGLGASDPRRIKPGVVSGVHWETVKVLLVLGVAVARWAPTKPSRAESPPTRPINPKRQTRRPETMSP